jgi:hypothetical protein
MKKKIESVDEFESSSPEVSRCFKHINYTLSIIALVKNVKKIESV